MYTRSPDTPNCKSDWRTCRVAPDASVREVLQRIQESELRIAVVTTDDDRLLGVATDGDVRRGILDGIQQEAPVTQIMNQDPVTAREHADRQSIVHLMRRHKIHQIPIVDGQGRVVRIEIIENVLGEEKRLNSVVIMAGGLGTRLRPITKDCPKPLVEVGGVPILGTLLDRLSAQGFQHVYLAVNYKAEMIEEYCGDGEEWGLDVQYLREQNRRGTAGSLSLLPERPERPLLVMNGDLLTTLNFGHLIDFHQEQSVAATMCVRGRDVEIPYGVVETNGHEVSDLEEKPTYRHFVNAGIYVLEPSTLDAVPDDHSYDMTEHFQHLVDTGADVSAYPVRAYWRDVGQKEDLHKAEKEFSQVFQ